MRAERADDGVDGWISGPDEENKDRKNLCVGRRDPEAWHGRC